LKRPEALPLLQIMQTSASASAAPSGMDFQSLKAVNQITIASLAA